MNSSGQIKFGETVGVLIIVYIVVMFGLGWYSSSNQSNLEDMQDDLADRRALEKYYTVLYSDFLGKSEQGFDRNYFDMLSLKAYEEYSGDKGYLERRYGESVITVDVINDSVLNDGDDPRRIVLYNNTPDFRDDHRIESMQRFTSLVSILDERKGDGEEEFVIGVLSVSVPQYRTD